MISRMSDFHFRKELDKINPRSIRPKCLTKHTKFSKPSIFLPYPLPSGFLTKFYGTAAFKKFNIEVSNKYFKKILLETSIFEEKRFSTQKSYTNL